MLLESLKVIKLFQKFAHVLIELGVELLEYLLVLVVVQGALDGLSLLFQSFFAPLLKGVTILLNAIFSICLVVVFCFIKLNFTLVVGHKSFDNFSEEVAVHVDVLDRFK